MAKRLLITSTCLLVLTVFPLAPRISASGHPGRHATTVCASARPGHAAKGRKSAACRPAPARKPVVLVLKGTVVSVGDTALVVQSAHDLTRTIALTDTTLIVAPDGSAAAVTPGDQVRVTARVSADGTATAVIVEDYSADSGTPSDATATTGDDASATPVPGQPTQAPTQTSQEPTQVPGQPTPVYQDLQGTITALDGSSLTIQAADGPHTFPLADEVSVRLADRSHGSISQVPVGTTGWVYVRSVAGGPFLVVGIVVTPSTQPSPTAPATSTPAEPTQAPTQAPSQPTQEPTQAAGQPVYQVVHGTITALDGSSLTVQATDGAHTFPLADQVSVRLADHSHGTLAQVQIGVSGDVYIKSVDGGPFLVVGVVVGAPS